MGNSSIPSKEKLGNQLLFLPPRGVSGVWRLVPRFFTEAWPTEQEAG